MSAITTAGLVIDRLFELVCIERDISSRTLDLTERAALDPEVADLLRSVHATALTHCTALGARLNALDTSSRPAASAPPSIGEKRGSLAPSAALREAFVLLSEAVMAYLSTIPVCNRFRDSPITASEGTTAHLARAHAQDYLAAMGKLGGALPAAVLRELVNDGYDCQCTCPACGIGLCACAIGARAIFNEAWLAARPEASVPDLAIPRPRSTSAAAAAGFQEGDRLESIDGTDITSYPQVQTTIKGHEMGASLRFTVRRRGKEHRIVVQRLADLGTGDLPLDCEAPSGAAFYLDRARDLRQRLRRRSGTLTSSNDGLNLLSPRETQVLRLLTDGATNPMIAAKLHISRPTVARHIANILRKLDVSNRSEAAAIAAESGLRFDA
jgi:DNA-binding CsgD family transcriptional regulator